MAGNKNKIAFVHNNYIGGGAEKVSAAIGLHMYRAGWEVYFYVRNLVEEKIEPEYKETLEFIKLPSRSYRSDENTRFITSDAKKKGIDIIVVTISPLGDMEYLRKNSGSRIVFSLHSIPFWEMMSRKINRYMKAKNGGIAKKLKYHLLSRPWYGFFYNELKKYDSLYRETYKNCDVYTVLCEKYKKDICDFLKIEKEGCHIEAINNFVSPKEYDEMPKKKQVIFMGRIEYVDKRVDRLLDIWDSVYPDYPDWELLIIGDGTDKANLQDMVKERAIGQVVFKGFMTDPAAYYRDASIICLTSNFEGWPLSIGEAQQAGVIPVCYNVSAGIEEQLAPDGVNGMLVAPFNKHEFIKKLTALMSDEKLREEMSRNVREKVKSFDREIICRQWEKLFTGLLRDGE